MRKKNSYNYVVELSNIFNRLIYNPIALTAFHKVGEDIKVSAPIFILGGEYITLGNKVSLNRNTRIEAIDEYAGNRYKPKVIIGNRVTFGPNCHIGCINKVSIGNDVLIGPSVLITDHSHGNLTKDDLKKPPKLRRLFSKGQIIIEDNVWIGEHVAILPGVTIGKNSIVGANSVVTKDIPANSVVAGNPVKIIKNL